MVARAVVTPDSFEQLVVGQHAPGIGGELEQQIVLGRGETRRPACHGDAAFDIVYGQVSDVVGFQRPSLRIHRPFAKGCLYPGDQLCW